MLDYTQTRDADLRAPAELLRLLGHPTRLALLTELMKGPRCVSDIQELLDVRQANVSQHLALLRRERILDYHEDGNLRCYYIVRPSLIEALVRFLDGRYPIAPRSAEWVREAARSRRECVVPSCPMGAGNTKTAGSGGGGMDRVKHWNQVYTDKSDTELSWYQAQPTRSLEIVDRLALPRDAAIIDVGGGGPSVLAGELLARGFVDVTVLDISSAALSRCRQRLADRAERVNWLEADVTRFVPPRQYDLWHDRAVFHFLTDPDDQAAYVTAIRRGLKPGGHAIIATFAPDGPPSCSNLEVVRWGPDALAEVFGGAFSLIESFRETHQTPWGKPQAFMYCLLRRVAEPSRTEGEAR